MVWFQSISKRIYQGLKPLLESRQINPHLFGASANAVNDDYEWMRSSPKKILKFIETENSYFQSFQQDKRWNLSDFKYFHQKLVGESSIPNLGKEDNGSFTYVYEKRFLEDFPVLTRSKDNCKEIVFDPNSRGSRSVSIIRTLRVSLNDQFVALTVENDDGQFECWIVEPKEKHPSIHHKIKNVDSFEWFDNDTLFFIKNDSSSNRNTKLFTISSKSWGIKLLYTELDERFSLQMSKSTDGKYVFVSSSSKDISEVFIAHSDSLDTIWSREYEQVAFVDHNKEAFYCLTPDAEDKEFCIMKQDSVGFAWKKIISRENGFINDFVLTERNLIILKNEDLVPIIQLYKHSGNNAGISKKEKSFTTPGLIEVQKEEITSGECNLKFTFHSPIQPLTHYSFNDGAVQRLSSSISTWEENNYRYKQIKATSEDGAIVPVSLFYKKGINLADSPMFCHVYGAYGVPVNLSFQEERAFLLNKGWILMFPHVRGGNEKGLAWYREGKYSNKINTLLDFRESLNTIHKLGISSPEKTAIYGKSAGALPVAWLLNQNGGQYCRAAIMQSPFVSVLHTMLLEGQQMTTQEYLEWGDPSKNISDFNLIKGYCPFINMTVSENDPAILVRTSRHDNHVPPWIPLQWVAKRRSMKKKMNGGDRNEGLPLLCSIEDEGGHYSRSLQTKIDDMAFLERFIH